MSIAKNASRFDFLPDDAGDPFDTVGKKNKKKDNSNADATKKKAPKKSSTNSDRKQLQNLAFGSATEGKKKSKGTAQTQLGGNGNINGILSSSTETNSDITAGMREQKNGNSSEKNSTHRPKGITNEQWEEWQKRDTDFMDETYVTDLQKAMLQSKIEYETEQKNKPQGKGKKKKPVAVPLNEFNARLNEGGIQTASGAHLVNGAFSTPSFASDNYQPQGPYDVANAGEDLVERFRMEAKLEMERERQKALERQLLMNRQPPPPVARPAPLKIQPVTEAPPTPQVDEKDLIINELREENQRLNADLGLLKDRVKTINNYLQSAQEVKDKAKLLFELDNLTKTNSELREELLQVHSQLEQEKSRSSAALLELRRMLENRRRTNTEGSTS